VCEYQEYVENRIWYFQMKTYLVYVTDWRWRILVCEVVQGYCSSLMLITILPLKWPDFILSYDFGNSENGNIFSITGEIWKKKYRNLLHRQSSKLTRFPNSYSVSHKYVHFRNTLSWKWVNVSSTWYKKVVHMKPVCSLKKSTKGHRFGPNGHVKVSSPWNSFQGRSTTSTLYEVYIWWYLFLCPV
jgi:hypothetical protein